MYDREVRRVLTGDPAAFSEVADDLVCFDHRLVVGGGDVIQGKARALEWLSGLAEVGFDTADTEVLAVRGERLGLVVSHRYAGEAKLEMLTIAEADGNGHGNRIDVYDVSQLDEAMADLDERYGQIELLEPERRAAWEGVRRLLLALNAQNGAALGASIADDGALEDHRPNSWGTVDRDQWIGDLPRGLAALARRPMGPPPGARAHRVGHLLRSRDARHPGWWLVRHPRGGRRIAPRRQGRPRTPLGAGGPCGGRGLVQGPAADARRAGVTTVEPVGRAGRAWLGAGPRPRLAGLPRPAPPGDRPHGPPPRGGGQPSAGSRWCGGPHAVDGRDGGDRRVEQDIVAVRGERHAVIRSEYFGKRFVVELLNLYTIDADGLVLDNHLYDVEQLDEAIALLDERFVEELPTDTAEVWRPRARVPRRSRVTGSRPDRCRALRRVRPARPPIHGLRRS